MSPYRRGTDPYLPSHGDDTYSVTHYDLDLAYNLRSGQLSGRAHLHTVVRQQTDRLVLDLHGLIVGKVTVDGRRATYRHRQGRLVVALPGKVLPGRELVVAVTYRGRPTEVPHRALGRTGWEELRDGSIVAAQPHGAPSWFPCNDRPDDKASYQIAATVPAGYRAVANGRIVARTTHAGSTTWRYEQPEPTPTYLAVLQTGRYEHLPVAGPVPIDAYVPRSLKGSFPLAFGRQGDMMAAFIELYGPYPFASYSIVVTQDILEIPLESQALSTFGANHLKPEWDCTRLVAHELSHQWFGNCLTLRRWHDIWLHEGFACYSEWLWSEVSGARSADEHAAVHHRRLAAMPQDLVLAEPGVADMFDDRVYKRGALTLHALRVAVGDRAFFPAIRGWVAAHRYGTVETGQFLEFMGTATGADVRTILTPWLWQRRVPPLPTRAGGGPVAARRR